MSLANETRSILEQDFITKWTTPTEITPIAYDNVPFDDNDPLITEYVETRFLVYTNENVTTGNHRTRIEGAFIVKIHTKFGHGTGRAWELSDLVDTKMSNITINDVTTRVSEARRSGDEMNGWFSLICSIPYFADECRV